MGIGNELRCIIVNRKKIWSGKPANFKRPRYCFHRDVGSDAQARCARFWVHRSSMAEGGEFLSGEEFDLFLKI